MKVRAHVNFALIKYWGKKDNELRLPFQASLSFTVDQLYTETEVNYDKELTKDMITINNVLNDEKMSKRVIKHLDYIRNLYNINSFAHVNSKNFVPTAAGLASSASSFAALSYAALEAADIKVTKDELSRISRIGSGSASRSIYSDFVIWNTGDDVTSVATPMNVRWDDFRIVVIIVDSDVKAYSSSYAMDETIKNKEEFSKWVNQSEVDLKEMIDAITLKDIDLVGTIAERNAIAMHDLIETTGIKYRTKDSHDVIDRIHKLRSNDIKAYYTMDAGPNVKIITTKDYVDSITNEFSDLDTIICKSGKNISIID